MKQLKVMTVFGTRPEAVKMAPLIKELKSRPEIDCRVCVTAQHREMLDQVLELFDIVPDYDLDIMKQRQTLIDITVNVLKGLDKVFKEDKPDIVLVHGDTSTTFVASLCAFYNKIRVGHVEAGLRTFDKYFPYPEEMNRKLTGVMADVHFSPTNANRKNLLNEGVDKQNIYVTGNTVIDALKTTVDRQYIFENTYLQNIDFNKRIIAVTAHRRENIGQPLEDICYAFKSIVEKYQDVNIVYSVHLNPVVQETARRILSGVAGVHLIEPLGPRDMHNFLDRCYMVMTDSGGLQEEAPSLGKPVLVLRNETERPEAVKAGTVKVIGTKRENVFGMASELLENDKEYENMAHAVNPYGDGNASGRITDALLYYYGISDKKPDQYSL